MIRKFEVRPGQFHFGHMAGGAILRPNTAGRRRGLSVRFRRRPRRFPAGGMTGQALGVVVSRVLIKRLVRVMASRTAYAAVIRVTLAVKYSVGLEANVVHSHALQRGELTGASMTGGAEMLRQFVAAEPRGIEDQFGVRLPRFTRGHVISAGAVTGFAFDAERQSVQVEIGAADRAGRVTTETIQGFALRETPPDSPEKRRRNFTRLADRKIQSFYLIVEAQEAFVIRAVILQHVSLPGLPLSECEKDGQRDRLLAVGDRVKALIVFASDLEREWAAAEGHLLTLSQNF